MSKEVLIHSQHLFLTFHYENAKHTHIESAAYIHIHFTQHWQLLYFIAISAILHFPWVI